MRAIPVSFARRVARVIAALFFAAFVAGCPQVASALDVSASPAKPIVSYERDDSTADIASRSWFGGVLSLGSSQRFGPCTFDGNNVGIEMTASCPRNGTFTVTLYRINPIKQRIGSATFKRNGFTKAVWENVGSGRYQFECTKSPDGATVTSNDVAIYSW